MTIHDRMSPTTHGERPLDGTVGELTAALASTASASDTPDERFPAALAARIAADGVADLRRQRLAIAPSPSVGTPPRARSIAWFVAAAAIVAWFLLPSPFASAGREDTPTGSAVALRDSLLTDSSVVRVAWAPSTDPAGRTATGEVLWDGRRQRGVMRFTGLVRNDPRVAQYQLWIVDAERDARYPVDGGVFDVSVEGELLVPIQPRLSVGRPTLFAVTLEPPGGVVVSDRERLVLAAPVG